MGGQGSGRYWHYGRKSTVNRYRSIDIRKWHRDKLLIPGSSFVTKWSLDGEIIGSIQVLAAEDNILLNYQYKEPGESKDMEYFIAIERTACNLGGTRPWFRCPARNCGRRAAILYGGSVFACRRCYQLAYSSQREHSCDRAANNAEKIRKRMKWEPGILNGKELKPKGMHWKTFKRLCVLHDKLVNISLTIASARFGINAFDLQNFPWR